MKNSLVSMTTLLGLMLVGAGVVFVEGCHTSEGSKPVEEDSPVDVVAGMLDDVVRRYGAWVGKGPQIISDTGEPLVNAKVLWFDSRHSKLSGQLDVDRKGRIVVDNYVTHYQDLDVSCPGFYSRRIGITAEGRLHKSDKMLSERDDCIVLRRKHRPHPMSKYVVEMQLPADVTNDVVQVDLVEGELLAPYGYGRHADAEFVFGATGTRGNGSMSVQLKLLGADDGAVDLQKFGDALGVPYEVDDVACTNRLVAGGEPVGLRIRGYYGNVLSAPRATLYTSRRRNAPEESTIGLNFSWRMNCEPGDRGLEWEDEDLAKKSHASPPKKRKATPEEGKWAFGVSSDGRRAVCFGRASSEVRVPDIFKNAVYTSEPVKDLPMLDTLYFERPVHFIPPRTFANHPTLRTAAIVDMSTETVREEAFAGCTNLNAFACVGWMDSLRVAENAFAGCAKDFTLVFIGTDTRGNDGVKWESVDCTNVVSRQVSVPYAWDKVLPTFGPTADFVSGEVEIPYLHFDGTQITCETSDGKVTVLDSAGRTTKRGISK